MAALTFDAFLGQKWRKGGPKGDQKTHFGPLGDQSPPKGTNVGAVVIMATMQYGHWICTTLKRK